MALITCSECSNQVSDKAESCPKCGAPIANARETVAAGTTVHTIQGTAKKFKLQTLLSITLLIIGFVWMITISSVPQEEVSPVPGLLIFIGIVWYLVNRFRIWWHHK